MTFDADLVDRIVRDVLSRLGTPGIAVRPEAGAAPATSAAATAACGPAPLVLDEPVVTGDLLEAKASAARVVIVGPRAIVTPSARDVVRRRGLDLRREPPQSHGASVRSAWRAVIMNRAADVQGVLSSEERRTGRRIPHELTGCQDEATKTAISTICRAEAEGVLLFVPHPAVAVCRANRNPAVRAAVLSDPGTWSALREAFSPNVVCVDPARTNRFGLEQVVRRTTAHAPTTPTGWEA